VGDDHAPRRRGGSRPLILTRGDATFYDGLFSRRDLDRVIAFTRPKFFDNLKQGSAARLNVVRGWLPDEETFAGHYPDLKEVHNAFGGGRTILITNMQKRWYAIAIMNRNLEACLGCRVFTNLYLTPPGAQGFSAHFDTHDVLILQIEGEKHWRLYGAGPELPIPPNDKSTIARDQLGAPTHEVSLTRGDLLYLPRGYVHEAFTSDSASLHLTVGISTVLWLDLLKLALNAAANGDVRFRRSVPPGLLCADAPPAALEETFQELLQRFAAVADLERAVEVAAEGFLSKLPALPCDYFAVDGSDQIDGETTLERSPGVICRVVEDQDGVVLLAPGACIEGPANIAPALRHIARTMRFTPAELPGSLSLDLKLALVRRLIRERLVVAQAWTQSGDEP
jgi:hypothetical protein